VKEVSFEVDAPSRISPSLDSLEEWEIDEAEIDDEMDDEMPCWHCVWWMDIADHEVEYYPEYDCCAPQFDRCCHCLSQVACIHGEIATCVFGDENETLKKTYIPQ